jgi:methionyl-tRNA synthetase
MTKFYITTAIDYPNSRPHIGTAFEKIGADVQARYRRMQGGRVHFLMGNDENTVKVSRRAAELGKDPKAYCDEMAEQFKDVWRALDISFDDFIQTSEARHHRGCQRFIQKVHDGGWIYQGTYEGWYCDGCESFKTETEAKEQGGLCAIHKTPLVRRQEPCHFFALSKFQDRLLKFYEQNPDFIQPATRRNEVLAFVQSGLQDQNITRHGQTWGIQVPFDPEFTIWVWFDALLNYITAIGYGSDEARFNEFWPADIHFIGKDITRFHCALWPAMCFAAGIAPPRSVFGHGFVYIKNEETGAVEKISKSLGNVVEPMEIVTKFSSDAFRYYFMRECPFPGDGEFSWQRFADLYNNDLANKLGNLLSRVVTLVSKNYQGVFAGTAGRQPESIQDKLPAVVEEVRGHLEACRYSQAIEAILLQVVYPANQYADRHEPWKLVKSDREAAMKVLYALAFSLRSAAILLKPFLPRASAAIYRSFDFPKAWEQVRYEDAATFAEQGADLRITAALEGGKPKPLFPRIASAV